MFQTVCRIDELNEGEARVFTVDNVRVALFRVGGEYFALADACPHAGASLARGMIQDDIVRCRIHHWRVLLTALFPSSGKSGVILRSLAIRRGEAPR